MSILLLGTEGGTKNWNAIAEKLPGRTNKDCRKRWHKIGPNIKKGVWTPEEDARLQEAVSLFGLKWTRVAEFVGSRNADQCSKRWAYALDPSLSHTPWTEEQDQLLLMVVNKFGHNWSKISSTAFGDRSTSDIKNRYFTLQRRKRNTSVSNTVASQIDDENHSDLGWPESGTLPEPPRNALLDVGTTPSLDSSSETPVSIDYLLENTDIAQLSEMNGLSNTSISPYEDVTSKDAMADPDPDFRKFLHHFDPSQAADFDGGNWDADSHLRAVTRGGFGREETNHANNGEWPDSSHIASTNPTETDTGSQSCTSTLVLEEMEPQTVTLVLSTLLGSNSRFRMRIDNN
ncbi:conserved hypothetical protein [Coccidioides posadasii str. Silveira]|uniref:Myb family transcription factor n=1 Tax=Coccidioides posadasii (strain RMSCC 757 / Silveira) TaxID=443226 RepID=E9DJZ8_COCPS|nr:conserved hypothetical protein [Coccidioides posadasii str. Silveira]